MATQAALLNSAPEISAMIGSFAPQGMNVVVMMVMRRSRSFSMVREAMMPVTPQPVQAPSVKVWLSVKGFPQEEQRVLPAGAADPPLHN